MRVGEDDALPSKCAVLQMRVGASDASTFLCVVVLLLLLLLLFLFCFVLGFLFFVCFLLLFFLGGGVCFFALFVCFFLSFFSADVRATPLLAHSLRLHTFLINHTILMPYNSEFVAMSSQFSIKLGGSGL